MKAEPPRISAPSSRSDLRSSTPASSANLSFDSSSTMFSSIGSQRFASSLTAGPASRPAMCTATTGPTEFMSIRIVIATGSRASCVPHGDTDSHSCTNLLIYSTFLSAGFRNHLPQAVQLDRNIGTQWLLFRRSPMTVRPSHPMLPIWRR